MNAHQVARLKTILSGRDLPACPYCTTGRLFVTLGLFSIYDSASSCSFGGWHVNARCGDCKWVIPADHLSYVANARMLLGGPVSISLTGACGELKPHEMDVLRERVPSPPSREVYDGLIRKVRRMHEYRITARAASEA